MMGIYKWKIPFDEVTREKDKANHENMSSYVIQFLNFFQLLMRSELLWSENVLCIPCKRKFNYFFHVVSVDEIIIKLYFIASIQNLLKLCYLLKNY